MAPSTTSTPSPPPLSPSSSPPSSSGVLVTSTPDALLPAPSATGAVALVAAATAAVSRARVPPSRGPGFGSGVEAAAVLVPAAPVLGEAGRARLARRLYKLASPYAEAVTVPAFKVGFSPAPPLAAAAAAAAAEALAVDSARMSANTPVTKLDWLSSSASCAIPQRVLLLLPPPFSPFPAAEDSNRPFPSPLPPPLLRRRVSLALPTP